MQKEAKVTGVIGNMVTLKFNENVKMNEVCYIEIKNSDNEMIKLKSEVIRIRDCECDIQIFEDSRGIKINDVVKLTDELLSIELGPGLLSNIFDGLGNPLVELSKKNYFLKKGIYLNTLDRKKIWNFIPNKKIGEEILPGDSLGFVYENSIKHFILSPLKLINKMKIIKIKEEGNYNIEEIIAQVEIQIEEEKKILDIKMYQNWPVKIPIKKYKEKLLPYKQLVTKIRIVDTFFPIAEGGTACMPGPFGSGKTVFQQAVSKFAEADIVIITACGERAGEVVEILKEFPEIIDPKTNKPLINRTVIICNTSSMPVAAREASVYTGITIAEYYRQMGLRVLNLVDSTSRWAQSLREMSGRLEEIPGEEAFPAYLNSTISSFYERAGIVKLNDSKLDNTIGSVTLIGTVSPAGGNFEEPVTQSTLSVVGCFLGLTYSRSYAKKFPAISPMDSWSKYFDLIEDSIEQAYEKNWTEKVKEIYNHYAKGQKIGDQIKLVGEEDLSIEEFTHFLKSEFFDSVYLQQDSFNKQDASPNIERIKKTFNISKEIIDYDFNFNNKMEARNAINKLTFLMKDLNVTNEKDIEYNNILNKIKEIIKK